MEFMTKQGKEIYNKVVELGLVEYYNPMSGNFYFDDVEIETNKLKIREWMTENKDYCLIYDDCCGWIFDDCCGWILMPKENIE